MSTVANPYQAPGARVADAKMEQYSEVKILSVRGRLGRARYIAYSLGLSLLVSLAIGVVSASINLQPGGAAALLLTLISYVAVIWLSIILSIQRAHDFNTTGWLSILALVPVLNLLFWIIPGTRGENRFGHPTPPNGALVIIAASIIPVIAALGIIAAIAIPAYQQYVQRSASTQAR